MLGKLTFVIIVFSLNLASLSACTRAISPAQTVEPAVTYTTIPSPITPTPPTETLAPSPTETKTATPTTTPTQTPTATATVTVTPLSPNQLAIELGWSEQEAAGTVLKQTDAGKILDSPILGVMGFVQTETGQWKSTKGWIEALRNSGLSLGIRKMPGQSGLYIVDGVVGNIFEDQIEISSPAGNLIGKGDFGFQLFGIDDSLRLSMNTYVLEGTDLNDGQFEVLNNWRDLSEANNKTDFWKSRLAVGKWVGVHILDNYSAVEA